jgi:YHS domain-containing protein
MKIMKPAAIIALVIGVLAPVAGFAGDTNNTAKPYPLTTCVISGEKLGEMAPPYIFVQDGQEVRLCCPNCLKDFKKDPAKYLKIIQDAEKAANK